VGSLYSDPEIVKMLRAAQHDLAVARLTNSSSLGLLQFRYETLKQLAHRRNIRLPEEKPSGK
jgi:hypothetical protein